MQEPANTIRGAPSGHLTPHTNRCGFFPVLNSLSFVSRWRLYKNGDTSDAFLISEHGAQRVSTPTIALPTDAMHRKRLVIIVLSCVCFYAFFYLVLQRTLVWNFCEGVFSFVCLLFKYFLWRDLLPRRHRSEIVASRLGLPGRGTAFPYKSLLRVSAPPRVAYFFLPVAF